MTPEPKRPISPFTDVAAGSIIWPLIITGIFYWLDTWLQSLKILSYPMNLIGLPSIISGVSLSIWCFNVALGIPKKPTLVTCGPWAHVRHPIYLAGMFVNLGVALMLGTVVQLFGTIIYALIDPLYSVPKEERELREAFPTEYEEYSKQTPRWIPKMRARNRAAFINGVSRVLESGGAYLMVCFSNKNGHAMNHFSKEKIVELFGDRFEIGWMNHVSSVEGDGVTRYISTRF